MARRGDRALRLALALARTPHTQVLACAGLMLLAGALISGLAFALTLMALAVAGLVGGLLREVAPARPRLTSIPSLEDVLDRARAS